jgi:uncharacterized membrane protein
VARLRILSTAQRIAVVVAAVFYIVAGALHFIKPAPYLRIMPPYIPWHAAMVRISGAFEILGGLGLLVPATRRAAAWGLVALLVAVFPANIYMAMHPIEAGAASIAPVLRWGASSFTTGPHLLGALVYPASLRAPLRDVRKRFLYSLAG